MIFVVFVAGAVICACIVLLAAEFRRYFAKSRNKQQVSTAQKIVKPSKVDWWSVTWTASLALVCLGIVAYGYFPQLTWSQLSYHLGRKVGEGVIVWMVFAVTIGRNQGSSKAGLSFLLIFGAAVASGLISYTRAQSAFTQFKTEFRQMVTERMNSQGPVPSAKREESTSPVTPGQFGELERLLKTGMNRLMKLQDQYSRELDATGLAHFLDPERLQRDGTLLQTRLIVQSAKDIVRKYETKEALEIESLRRDIANLRIDAASRSEVSRGFNDALKKSRPLREAMWKCEVEVISVFEKVAALLTRTRNAWRIQDGQIVFESENDLIEFNSYRQMVEELAKRQEAILKRNMEFVEQWMK